MKKTPKSQEKKSAKHTRKATTTIGEAMRAALKKLGPLTTTELRNHIRETDGRDVQQRGLYSLAERSDDLKLGGKKNGKSLKTLVTLKASR
jgi:hypothetical protein